MLICALLQNEEIQYWCLDPINRDCGWLCNWLSIAVSKSFAFQHFGILHGGTSPQMMARPKSELSRGQSCSDNLLGSETFYDEKLVEPLFLQ
jgi:hypothetical protein